MALTLTQQQIDDLITTANQIVDNVYSAQPSELVLKDIVVTFPGTYTTTVPTVTIQAPPAGGTNATAVALLSPLTVSSDRYIQSIVITNPGSGYTSTPTVTISGSGGGLAVAITEQKTDDATRSNLVSAVLAQLITEAINANTAQLTLIEGHQENISVQQSTIATQQTTIATQQTTMATQQTTMATQQTTIAGHQGTIAAKTTVIADETTTIDNHLNRIQAVVKDIDWDHPELYDRNGPFFRMMGDAPINTEGDIARAMMMINLKKTNTLQELKNELKSPTPLK